MNAENTGVSKYTVSFGVSFALACVLNALLVVVKEKSPAVMAGMAKLTGHHWISHGVIVLGFFAVGGWLLAQLNGGRGPALAVNRLLGVIVAGVMVGGVIIIGFYLIGD